MDRRFFVQIIAGKEFHSYNVYVVDTIDLWKDHLLQRASRGISADFFHIFISFIKVLW